MTPVELIGAVGDQQQDADAAQRPDQERDQLTGGLVGPVQILEHQHDRLAVAEPAQQAENQFKQLSHLNPVRRPVPGGFCRGIRVQFGQEPAQAAPGRAEHLGQLVGGRRVGQRAQRVDERGERQSFGAELDALAGQHHEPAAGGPAG